MTWVTDRGYLYVGRIDRRSEDSFVAKYRLGTNGTFSNPPAYLPPRSQSAGRFGRDFRAVPAMATSMPCWNAPAIFQWKFATSDPVIDSPVVIEDRVYVTTELGGMFCLNAKTGKQIWWAPEMLHFVAAGKQRVYAADKLGRLRILDARTGATLDSLPASAMPIKISNGQTRSDLPGHGRGHHPVSARGGPDQSGRLQREPQAAAGRRSAQGAPKPKPKSGDERCVEGGARPPCGQEDRAKKERRGDAAADAIAADKPAKPAEKGKKGRQADEADRCRRHRRRQGR